MSIHFRGGELQQKGKGIGGFFRAFSSILKPFLKTVGRSVISAAKSNTGRAVGKAISEQALDSALNMTRDVLAGNSLKDSFENETSELKSKAINAINNIKKRKRQTGHGVKVKKRKRLKTKFDDMKQFFV